jgi:SAM-dependent methyltransferase
VKAEHLRRIREDEVDFVCDQLGSGLAGSGARLLEIGAGPGWQAQRLSQKGFEVHAIDVANPLIEAERSGSERVFPVTLFDGRRLPFADASFDLVFSSNVLEHVTDLTVLQVEMRRVLRPSGRAIHLLPSGSWRFWTILAHYPWIIGRGLELLARRIVGPPAEPESELGRLERRLHAMSPGRRLLRASIPARHGELGNAFSELRHFSRYRWNRHWDVTGWRVLHHGSSRLFYTGYSLLGDRLPLSARRGLAALLGGACHFYVLEARGHLASREREVNPELSLIAPATASPQAALPRPAVPLPASSMQVGITSVRSETDEGARGRLLG